MASESLDQGLITMIALQLERRAAVLTGHVAALAERADLEPAAVSACGDALPGRVRRVARSPFLTGRAWDRSTSWSGRPLQSSDTPG